MVKIGEKQVGNITIVLLDGKIDSSSSLDMEKKINELIDRGNKYLVVNLAGIEYISSSGLRVMLSSLKRLKKVQGDLKVTCTRPLVRNVFDMAGFTQIFEFYDREEDALSRFVTKA
ncbi:MAG TPA: STAS domain-containing protein [Methanocella sp.]|jgi:anti-sigma B factor antagonist